MPRNVPQFDQEILDMYADVESVPAYIKDAAREVKGCDASETLVFARQLEQIKARLYERKYAELKGTSLVPMSAEAGVETEYMTYRIYDGRTLAVLVSNYATDWPLVSASAEEVTLRYHLFGNSYGYSMLELRQAAAAGVELQSRYAMLARKGHDLALDDAIATGVPQIKTFGLINHPNATTVSLPTGSWSTATGEQILSDLNYLVTKMMNDTLEILQGDTLVMSVLAYRLISTKLLNSGNGSNITVLEAFKNQNPGISVSSWTKLANANAAGNNGRIVFYKKDAEVLEFEMGRFFEVMEPNRTGIMLQFPCMSKFAGLAVHQPAGLFYADNQLI